MSPLLEVFKCDARRVPGAAEHLLMETGGSYGLHQAVNYFSFKHVCVQTMQDPWGRIQHCTCTVQFFGSLAVSGGTKQKQALVCTRPLLAFG